MLSLSNMLIPAILIFAPGILAQLVRSDLKFPSDLAKVLSIYLLVAVLGRVLANCGAARHAPGNPRGQPGAVPHPVAGCAFPFNIIVGIPLDFGAAQGLAR